MPLDADNPGSAPGPRPVLTVLTGPSGVGKDLLLSRLPEGALPRHIAVTATTRPMRSGERDGVHYHFVDKPRFEAMIAGGELLEWASVYGNYYGIPKAEVDAPMAAGMDVIIKADVQGAATIKRMRPDAVAVFLAPPSLDELRRRLAGRETETPAALELRLETAAREIAIADEFDYVVAHHTDGTDAAARELLRVIAAARGA